MKNKNATDTLNEMIIVQKMIYDNDLEQLKLQFEVAYESVKPINFVKNLFREVTVSPEIKNNLLSNIIGFGTGLISKKLLLGFTHNPIKKVLGTLFEFAVANSVSKHSDGIKAIGGNLFKRFFNKNKTNKNLLS
ncbi:MAG TPA: hypothetical protein DCM02_06850 [Flavobacterium sp.]|nr:hypothetical protein [Flavobacterium sp.]HAT76522.1 hypothetical protein [Flavobacterium sp.]HAT81106.1 hypothetical protein [Flavobacterium sp.]